MGKKSKQQVCLVIPAYNESAVIGDVIRSLHDVFQKSRHDYHILVVDDGSKDKTAKAAKEAGAHVIQHLLNSGSGSATATGLSYAHQHGYHIAATLDADGQHDPADVLEGIERLQEGPHDMLIGSRLLDSEGMSRVKILGNRGLSFITYVLFGINVTDSQSGLRIFSRKALANLKWKTSGYEFCSEMLWRARQVGLMVGEYPIKAIYTEYSKGKGQNNWNAFNIIKVLMKKRIVELFSE